MCGVGGTIGCKDAALDALLTSLAHRGPDWQGVWRDGNVGIGHRLLSIRAASDHSHQPYTRSDSPWILSFNGQIYNTDALKRELNLPQSEDLDTAVLFALIEREGWNFCQKAFGMYAIALYNSNEKILRLYRDSSGQKPLYFSTGYTQFAFASEIKGVLAALPNLPRIPDTVAVELGQYIGYVPGKRTLLKNIHQVMPGEVVTFNAQGHVTESRNFSTLAPSHFEGDARSVIRQCVHEHMQSKQKVALNLSGGMDSSVLLHEIASMGHTVHTYTTSFSETPHSFNDDALLASKLAAHYGTKHTELNVTPSLFLSNLRQAYETIEMPDYNISLPAYLSLAKREGVHGDGNRVVITGDGGDEVFGGYSTFRNVHTLTERTKKFTPLVFNFLKFVQTREWWNYEDPIDQWLHYRKIRHQVPRARIIAELRKALPLGWDTRKPDAVKDALILFRAFWLAPENFVRGDKLYMSQSVETRAPFAYEPLRAYFDARLTTKDYLGPHNEKHFFRSLYENVLPDYITKRPTKSGWRAPIMHWWDERFHSAFAQAFDAAPRGGTFDWVKIRDGMPKDKWPGKQILGQYSLAVLAAKFNIVL